MSGSSGDEEEVLLLALSYRRRQRRRKRVDRRHWVRSVFAQGLQQGAFHHLQELCLTPSITLDTSGCRNKHSISLYLWWNLFCPDDLEDISAERDQGYPQQKGGSHLTIPCFRRLTDITGLQLLNGKFDHLHHPAGNLHCYNYGKSCSHHGFGCHPMPVSGPALHISFKPCGTFQSELVQ